MIKLDLKDKKILSLLGENARTTNSQIAKRVGLSKPAVEYRIKRFEKNDLIFKNYTTIDFTKLGYSQYKTYIKFQNTSIEEEQRIIKFLNKSKNTVWIAQVRGRWDLSVSFLAKSNYEFGKIFSEFTNKFSKFILEKDILLTEYSPVYSREYLNEITPKEFTYGAPTKEYKLDETDKTILKKLSSNSRVNIIDLSEKTKLSRDIVNYRIKKLIKEDIIISYNTYPKLENLGINLYKIIFRTKNFDSENETKIKNYVKGHKKATQLLKLIGSWDLEIEFETENEDELYKILNEIRIKFSEIIRDFDILRITKTFKLNFYPF